MRVLAIENYPGTTLGQVQTALDEKAALTEVIAAHAGEVLPDDDAGYDGLVVLGGEQNALADEAYPFLPKVCDLIRQFHEAGKPVLGICLGCQLIARAFGGGNILGRPVEFGWQDIRLTKDGKADPVLQVLKSPVPLFHWHSDTVALPEGAVHLASSNMTPNQAFRLGTRTYAIQFHFEAGLELVGQWSDNFAASIVAHTPEWPRRFEAEAKGPGALAEKAGLDLARAWVSLMTP